MINKMERFINPIYTFGKSRSASIVFMFVINSYFVEQKDFIFAESGRHYISKINLALLAAARSMVTIAVSYCMYLTFKEQQPCRNISSFRYSRGDYFIDVLAMITSFFSPLIVMKSTLILMLFGTILLLFLYIFLGIYNLFHKNPDASDAGEQTTPPPAAAMRTRSGMIFIDPNQIENDLQRLRDQVAERRTPSVARRSSARNAQ